MFLRDVSSSCFDFIFYILGARERHLNIFIMLKFYICSILCILQTKEFGYKVSGAVNMVMKHPVPYKAGNCLDDRQDGVRKCKSYSDSGSKLSS
jgi:hypothetical protein